MGQQQEKKEYDRKSNTTKQKNKRMEKWDQTESTEIPVKGVIRKPPGLPSGDNYKEQETNLDLE